MPNRLRQLYFVFITHKQLYSQQDHKTGIRIKFGSIIFGISYLERAKFGAFHIRNEFFSENHKK